ARVVPLAQVDRHHRVPADLPAVRLAETACAPTPSTHARVAAENDRDHPRRPLRAPAPDSVERVAVQLVDRGPGRLPWAPPARRPGAQGQGTGGRAPRLPCDIELHAACAGLCACRGGAETPLRRPRHRSLAHAAHRGPAPTLEGKRLTMVLFR